MLVSGSILVWLVSIVVFLVGWAMAKLTMNKDRGGKIQLAGAAIWVLSMAMCGVGMMTDSRSTGVPAADRRAASAPAVSASAPTTASVQCEIDLKCWAERHSAAATVRCDDAVERLAKYSHKWTDGFLEPKFSHFRWRERDKGTVTYIGDKIQFQNGFGALQNHIYECDFDPRLERVVDARARPGRLE